MIEVCTVEATIFHSYFHGLHPTCRARVLKLTMTRRGGLEQKENHPWQKIKATFPVKKKDLPSPSGSKNFVKFLIEAILMDV